MYLRSFSLILLLASSLWAGRYLPARPNEPTVADELIVEFVSGNPTAILAQIVPGGQARKLHLTANVHVVKLPAPALEHFAQQLANHPSVGFVEPNRIRRVSVSAPNDPSFGSLWGLQSVGAVPSWTLMPNRYLTAADAGANRTLVAVLDTGIDCAHADFKNLGGTSTDAALGGQIGFAQSQAIVPTTAGSPPCAWQDDHSHGTHVAGTIAASANNVQGVTGLAYNAVVAGFKILAADGSGTDVDIANAIALAADRGARMISLSLGGDGYSQTLQSAVSYAWERNSLVVAAAGNSATDSLFFPAGATFALGVAAIDSTRQRASFSNFGTYVGIAAPGVNILSTTPGSTYGYKSGTSMATPHVSGLGALVASTTANVPVAAVMARLQQSADNTVGGGGWADQLGYGIINAAAATSGTLRPSTLGSIVGQVTAGGFPVSSAQISWAGGSTIADVFGLYRIANLPSGEYSLTIIATGQPAQTIRATVPAGADAVLPIRMGTGYGHFNGAVTTSGLPRAGAVVQAISGGLIKATAWTTTAGQYVLAVPAGTYDIRVGDVGAVASTVAALTISAGTNRLLNVSLPTLGLIAGTVTDPAGLPISGAQISISGTGSTAGAVTLTSGAYQSIGLPAGSYTVTATATGYPTATVSNIVVGNDVRAVADLRLGGSTGSFTPIRVNAGGPAYTDPTGKVWAADTGFLGGTSYSTSAAIANTTTAPLYQSDRFQSGNALQYRFAVPNGSYSVVLKFAEIYFSTAGQRVFNIVLNGQTVATNFDVVAAAGGAFRAVDRTFAVSVTTGQLAIDLPPVIENPKINAIEITSGTISGVAISLSPGSATLNAAQQQQFTATVTGSTNTAVGWSLNPTLGSISATGLYTAPSSIAIDQTVILTVAAVADPTRTATATINLKAPISGFVPIRVNAGGPPYTDPTGKVWSADTGFLGGTPFSTTAAIANTTTAPLYQSDRFQSGNTLQYRFAVPNGTYSVVLKFAEIYFSTAGQRVFNILLNGQTVQPNFDVVAAAGGALRAVDRTFTASVTNGQIAIDLTPVIQNPKINAIEITSGTAGVAISLSPGSATLNAGQQQQFIGTVTGSTNTAVRWSLNPAVGSISATGLYTAPSSIAVDQTVILTAAADADPSQTATATINLKAPVTGFTPIRVNAGGPAYTDPTGKVWSADTGYLGGSPYSTTAAISNTTTAPLYQSERFQYGNTLQYRFAVPNGTYTVVLKFAEIYFNSAGQRVFNIVLNGQTVATNFDVVAAAGGAFRAVDRTFTVSVTNGQIAIDLPKVIENPKINAIEVF